MSKIMRTTVLALVGVLLTSAGSLNAAPLIEESFDYDTGSISGGSGGTGFTGNWATRNTAPAVATPGLEWGPNLNVAGNSVKDGGDGGSAYRDIGATSVLDSVGLMGNGQTLWFSVIVSKPTNGNANVDFNFSLGTDGFHQYVAGSGGTFGERTNLESGEGIGLALVNRNSTQMDLEGAYWIDSDADDNAERVTTDAINRWAGPTVLIVGKIDWGANDLANETLTLYAPDTDLNLGSALLTWNTIAALDQSAFDTVAFELKGGGTIDEIRFGAASGDVLPVPEPASLAMGLVGLGGLLIARRRRGDA